MRIVTLGTGKPSWNRNNYLCTVKRRGGGSQKFATLYFILYSYFRELGGGIIRLGVEVSESAENFHVVYYILGPPPCSSIQQRPWRWSIPLSTGRTHITPDMWYVNVGMGSRIPCIFQVSDCVGSIFARSLRRIKSGIHQTQAQGTPSTLGGDFPYEPGDLVQSITSYFW